MLGKISEPFLYLLQNFRSCYNSLRSIDDFHNLLLGSRGPQKPIQNVYTQDNLSMDPTKFRVCLQNFREV